MLLKRFCFPASRNLSLVLSLMLLCEPDVIFAVTLFLSFESVILEILNGYDHLMLFLLFVSALFVC